MVVKLYTLHDPGFSEFELPVLEPGLSVLLVAYDDLTVDYFGGTLKGLDWRATPVWVDLLEVQDEIILGRTKETCRIWDAGSVIRFRKKHICRVSGSRQWNIEHLCVLVSEKIFHQREAVGYFYSIELEHPRIFGLIFYSRSEVNDPKENIALVEVALSDLVFWDPVVATYLDYPAQKGMIRTDDVTFKEFDQDFRDQRFFPMDYCVWEEKTEDD